MVGKDKKENALHELRVNYTKGQLHESELPTTPSPLFHAWLQDARVAGIQEPNAMVLSTVREGKPSARVVLLKGLDDRGFVFFSNYLSHKGEEIALNPHAAITFFWDKIERQVRIEGIIEKTSEEESVAYFQSRPRLSQIGAWTSNQSFVIENRRILEEKFERIEEKFKTTDPLPKPPYWGGYILRPTQIEFWQGRSSRLHDRILYVKEENKWQTCRLSP
jgi:pyridoxamine 5'-phosphate oxidase